jgi:hypothetical protein
VPDTVILEDLRCDGAGHGGCEADCRIFWKEAWLRRVPPGEPRPVAVSGAAAPAGIEERLAAASRVGTADGPEGETYRCQATELVRASHRVRVIDARSYLRVLASGSVPPGRFVRVMGRAIVMEALSRMGRLPDVVLAGDGTPATPPAQLGLQPGDWVQVRSPEEIRKTLNPQGRHRGLWFDREMLPFCGGTYRVRRRVTHIIDERTGRMLRMKSDCIMLEGAVCSGENSLGRWFCPRGIFPYWRESWLRRVDPPGSGSGTRPAGA